MLRRYVLIVGGAILLFLSPVLQKVIADLIHMVISPHIKEPAEQLLPFLGQQAQSLGQQIQSIKDQVPLLPNIRLLPQYMIDRDIKTVISYVAAGQVDRASIVLATIWSFCCFTGFIFILMMLDSSQRQLRERGEQLKWYVKLVGIIAGMLLVGASLWLMNQSRLVGIAVIINNIFNRNLAIIAPHIPEHQEKQLRSKIRLIKTREDVQAIDDEVLPIMREKGIPISGEQASESSTTQ
jgi:hypothetical protein